MIFSRILAACVLIAAAVNAAIWMGDAPVPAARHVGAAVSASPAAAISMNTHVSGVVAIALAMLGLGVLRRRRLAWLGLCATLLGVTVLGGLHHESGKELAPLAAAGAAVAASRRSLVAEPDLAAIGGRSDATLQEIAAIVGAHGSDTLAPFKVRSDVAHLVSDARDAVLAYRVENGAMIVAADPVGTPEGCRELLASARELARRGGLGFAIASASQQYADWLEAHTELRPIYMGCEAIVDPTDFSLTGRRIKKVRQAHARVLRSGISLDTRPLSALAPSEHVALRDCQERGRQGAAEQSFTMAPDDLASATLAGGFVVRARTEDGTVKGALIVMPVAGARAWTLALQHRDPDSPNGVIDGLIVHLLQEAQSAGIQRVSLNFAAARRYMYEPVEGFWPNVARLLARLATRLTQIDTLRAHNEKFSPTWEPRYLMIERSLALPRVAFATIWQEGQLPRPSLLLAAPWPQPQRRSLSV